MLIKINQDKAIEITKEKIRAIREPMFTKLDVEFQMALEKGLDTSEIVAEKQRLRDLTDSANDKTPDELLLILKQLEGAKLWQ